MSNTVETVYVGRHRDRPMRHAKPEHEDCGHLLREYLAWKDKAAA